MSGDTGQFIRQEYDRPEQPGEPATPTQGTTAGPVRNAARLTEKGREVLRERGGALAGQEFLDAGAELLKGPTNYSELADVVKRDIERSAAAAQQAWEQSKAGLIDAEVTIEPARVVQAPPTLSEAVLRGTRELSRSVSVWGPPAEAFKPRITLGQTPDRCYNVVEVLAKGTDGKLTRAQVLLDERSWMALRRAVAGTIDEEAAIEPPDALYGGPTGSMSLQVEYARLRAMAEKQGEMIQALQRERAQLQELVQRAVQTRDRATQGASNHAPARPSRRANVVEPGGPLVEQSAEQSAGGAVGARAYDFEA